MERRLAAVLIADVVGYGRLSQTDEEGTRARFQADLNEVFGPAIAERHGRLVKTMGDGLLVEFRSVVDALRCAVQVQRLKADRNAGLAAGQRLVFRIGINLGDVIVEDEDIHGDGVNIAARLEALADAGSIVLSGSAYDQVKDKAEVGFAYLGEHPVKNVATPIRVYRVLLDPRAAGKTIRAVRPTARQRSRRWQAVAAAVVLVAAAGVAVWLRPWEHRVEAASMARMALPLPDKPSIAVLPFTNMSDDPKQAYFADGMTDDLITEISKIPGVFVIGRSSTFAYQGKPVKIAQVAEELGVRYVVQGSVQRAGDTVRINAQLIDALSGGSEWADRFDGTLAEVFALQDQVTHSIADALALRINPEEAAKDQQETKVPAAYDAFLRGWEHFRRTTPEDYKAAIPYLQEAIRLDPSYGRAYAALALVYVRAGDRSYGYKLGTANRELFEKAKETLEEARKHPSAQLHQVAGYLLKNAGALDEAVAEFKEAVALDPSDSWSYLFWGVTVMAAGRAPEAIQLIRTAMRLDPHYPGLFLYFLGTAQFAAEQLDEAVQSLEGAAKVDAGGEEACLLAAAYALLGRIEEAKAAAARYDRVRVERGEIPTSILTAPSLHFWKSADKNRLKKGLRLAGVPETLFSGAFSEKNRLTAEEVRALFFGHRLHGRDWEIGDVYGATVAADGATAFSDDWTIFKDGTPRFEEEKICYMRVSEVEFCGNVYRNPGAPHALENEYIWNTVRDTYTFSLVP